ncbi:MAG: VOC family protein [Jatrophihabitans sp.]|uniref:VOC family protein n=1 Tax=Jatrophihabitans sp. TaxID=1932789 RepID=UPI0039148E0D
MPAPALLSGITVDCVDPTVLAGFWSALLDRQVTVPLPGWLRLDGRAGADPVINFQPVPEPKHGKARIHLDLVVEDIDEGTAAVLRLGGRSTGERHEYAEGVVLVMADPEGNEFCITQYYAG